MLQQQRARLAYLLVLPALSLVVLLNLLPLVQGVIISMQNQNMIRPNPEAFVGFRHYARALTEDGEFWRSTWHSFYFTIGAVTGAYFLSLGLALLLNQSIRGRGLFRALFLIPWVVPEVVTALLWKWLYSDQWGFANFALLRMGIVDDPVLWLSQPSMAMPSIIIVQIWKLYPIMTVVLLAALQSVPGELMEAARIDGANAFQRFWYVTANFLRPTSIIIVLLACIWTFQNFDIVYLLTGGGPAGSTQTLPVMVYVKAFWASQLGYASAIGVIILLILLMLGFLSLALERLLSRDRRAGMSDAVAIADEIRPGINYRRMWAAVATYSAIFIALTVILFPILWMFLSSFKGQTELFARDMTLFPVDWTLENYINVWRHTPFPRYFWNSLYIAAITTAITVTFAIYAAYAIARLQFRGRLLIGIVLLATQMFPHVTLVLPLFMIIRNLGLFDTHAALIIANVAYALPFAVWMLRGFFVAIPAELEDAAAVDGAGMMTTIHRIIVPLAGPGIAAIAMFTFIRSWNEFLFALVLLQSQSLRTLPLGLASFQEEYTYRWDLMMAGGSIVSLPVLIFFLLMQRFIVQGLLGGALKG